MVIGKQGRVMKGAGTDARVELERLLDSKVNLKLWAKVKENWSDNDAALRTMGYE